MITAQGLQNLLPEFIAYLNQASSSRSTVKNYSSDLRRLLEKLPSDLPIDNSHLDQSLEILKTEFSEATIRRFTYSLKAFTVWLNSKGFDFTSPTVSPTNVTKAVEISPIVSYVAHIQAEGAPEKTTKLYEADLNNFFSWLKPAGTSLNQRIINKVSRFDINRYISFLKSKQVSQATINRYLYSLKGFFNFQKADIVYETNPVTLTRTGLVNEPKGFLQKLRNRIKKPRFWHAYRGHPISDYLNYAAFAALTLFIGVGLFQQLFPSKPLDITNLRTEIQKGLVLAATPPRILSFQGRLTNNSGTPIVAATNVVFNIYSVRTGGTTLWTSKTWSVTPDQNGIFSVCLGGQDTTDNCLLNAVADTVIPSTLFANNAALYLGVTIGADSEATPRQRIASSSYALNSAALEGLASTDFLRATASTTYSSGTLTTNDGTTLAFNSNTIGIGNASTDAITVNGQVTDSYSTGTDAASGIDLTATNSSTSGTVTINAIKLTPKGTSTAGINTVNSELFVTPQTPNSNNFYGLNFQTGYTDILRYNNTQLISGTGVTGLGLTLALGSSTISGTLASTNGGTGQNFSAATGVPSISSGTWSVNSVLPTSFGGTNTSSIGAAGTIVYSNGTNYAFSTTTASSGQCLLSGTGGTGQPTWSTCPGGSTRLDQILAATLTPATIDSTNFAQTWNWSTLTTQRAFTFDSTATGLTTGGILGVGSSTTTYNHGAATETGNLVNLTFKDATTGTATSTTTGLNIAPTLNVTTGASGTKTLNGVNIAPVLTACTGGSSCLTNGINLAAITNTAGNTASALKVGTGWDSGFSVASGGNTITSNAASTLLTLTETGSANLVNLCVTNCTGNNLTLKVDSNGFITGNPVASLANLQNYASFSATSNNTTGNGSSSSLFNLSLTSQDVTIGILKNTASALAINLTGSNVNAALGRNIYGTNIAVTDNSTATTPTNFFGQLVTNNTSLGTASTATGVYVSFPRVTAFLGADEGSGAGGNLVCGSTISSVSIGVCGYGSSGGYGGIFQSDSGTAVSATLAAAVSTGTKNIITLNPANISAGVENGLNLGSIASNTGGTANAINIGTGWDLAYYSTGGLVGASGTFGSDALLPTSLTGAGSRLVWYPRKAAFRAGYVSGTQWDDASIGNYSAAFGASNTVSATYGLAAGTLNTVSGGANAGAFAFGYGNTVASDYGSTALGYQNSVSGIGMDFALGWSNSVTGYYANLALGYNNSNAAANFGNLAGGNSSSITAGAGSGNLAFGFGSNIISGGSGNFALGNNNTISSSSSANFALGISNTVSGAGSAGFALGQWTAVTASNAFSLGLGTGSASLLTNATANSLLVGFNSTAATIFVGPSAGGSTTGSVGIGNSSPGAKLDVQSVQTSGSLTQVKIPSAVTPTAALTGLNLDLGNATNVQNRTGVNLAASAVSATTTTTPLQSSGIGACSPTASDYNMGYNFTPQSNGYITSLGGRWDTGSRTVRLYDAASANVLATAQVSGGGTTVWVYTTVTPVMVLASKSYVVAVRSGSGNYCSTTFTTPATSGGVVINNSIFNAASDTITGATAATGAMYGQADVVFTPQAALALNLGAGWDNYLFGNLGPSTSLNTIGSQIITNTATTSGGQIAYSAVLGLANAGTSQTGLNIEGVSGGAGNKTAVNIGNLNNPGTGTETAVNIGSGWDTAISAAGAITTSGNISTTGSGTITSAGLLTGSLGLTVSGAAVSINASANFTTNINTGTSNGTITIGNSASTAIKLGKFTNQNGLLYVSATDGTVAETAVNSGATQCLTQASSAAPAWGACAAGGSGPFTSTGGIIDYTTATDRLRLRIGATGTVGLNIQGIASQTAPFIQVDANTTDANPIFNLDSAGKFNFGAGGASATDTQLFRSAANTISLGTTTTLTTAGALTIDSNTTSALNIGTLANAKTITIGNNTSTTALNLQSGTGNINLLPAGSGTTGRVQIGAGGSGSATPDLLVMDVKSTTGDPTGTNGAMYYNSFTSTFRCFEASAWKDCIPKTAVPNNVKNTANTTANTVSVTETSLSIDTTITPSSTANVVLLSGFATLNAGATKVTVNVRRGTLVTSTLVVSTICGENNSNADLTNNTCAWTAVDSPASASAVTYSVWAIGTVASGTLTNKSNMAMEVKLGADLAEIYNTHDKSINFGQLVSIDPTLVAGVKKSTAPYDRNLLGVVSTRPSVLMGGDGLASSGAVPVALSGRVPVRVSLENGPISVGDPLTSSSTPGVAMKATRSGYIVGRALGSFTEPGVGLVLAFVNTNFVSAEKLVLPETSPPLLAPVNPFLQTDNKNNLIVKISDAATFAWKNSLGKTVALVNSLGEAVFAKITALAGDFQQLVFGDLIAKKSFRIAGQASFTLSATEVFIASDKVRADSLINLTPVSKTNGFKVYIKEVKPNEGFIVSLERDGGDQPNQATASAISALKFNWLIINQQ